MRAPRDVVVLFVGPTLATSRRRRALVRGLRVRRPARRGDVESLVRRRGAPGVIVLADGVFHDSLAVGHAELREALERGWSVWGVSSMGAIRAREMAHLGLRGFGVVYERFCAAGDFTDDEVALLHAEAPSYRAVSEPMIHLRNAMNHLVDRGLVLSDTARDVATALKARWYGDRTIRAVADALSLRSPEATAEIRRELREFDRFRLKTLDLERLLETRPW